MLMNGVFAATTTPFYPDEHIYFRKIEANVARYSRSLLAGMIVLGSTGEAVMLDDGESRDVMRAAVEAAAPEKVMVAGVGRESVKATVALAEAAAEFEYDAVLVRPPSYYLGNMTPPAILNYFRSIADRSPLPVILYNIPRCVPLQIPIEVIGELANHPNIIGIKDSSGSVERIQASVAATKNAPRRTVQVTEIFEAVTSRMANKKAEEAGSFVAAGELAGGAAVATAPPAVPLKTRTKEVGFQVLCGAGGAVLESLKLGATGAILAFGACAPQACQEIYLAWKDHDMELATEKQEYCIAAANKRIVVEISELRASNTPATSTDFTSEGRPRRNPILERRKLTSDEKTEVEGVLGGDSEINADYA